MNILIKIWVSWILNWLKDIYFSLKTLFLKKQIEKLKGELNEQKNISDTMYNDFMHELSEYKSSNKSDSSGDPNPK